ncbi:pentatricopeptide repeat-containing protein, chloroplastic-like protein [Salvia divinorum]|uniref:Pentatricopeptide repeat-containing protein, chloroplastic-like protein n=1 Tax=Salvia divinorum TaxID=28513 RepID=A0ABD1HHJ4_SALDI
MNLSQLSIRQVFSVKVDFPVLNFSARLIKASSSSVPTRKSKAIASPQRCRGDRNDQSLVASNVVEKKLVRKSGRKEHHLWQRRDQTGSGQKALNLIQIICGLPNEKEAVYSALDEWIAWETEFPLIAAAKAMVILRKRSQWKRIIQVAKWMLSKGQGATMATYDHLLLAFDMDRRPDEAKTLWNMILHAHNRSISKRLFSRMISLYDHHNMPNDVIEVFADMEELEVKPDEDTVRRIARAFEVLGQEDKHKQFLMKYQRKWKYIHFKGERVQEKTV